MYADQETEQGIATERTGEDSLLSPGRLERGFQTCVKSDQTWGEEPHRVPGEHIPQRKALRECMCARVRACMHAGVQVLGGCMHECVHGWVGGESRTEQKKRGLEPGTGLRAQGQYEVSWSAQHPRGRNSLIRTGYPGGCPVAW